MRTVQDTRKVPAVSERKATATDVTPQAEKRDDFSFSLNNFLRYWGMELDQEHEEQQRRAAEQLKEAMEGHFKLLTADDLANSEHPLSMWDVLRIDPNDAKAQSTRMGEVRDYQTGQQYYLSGRALERFEARRAAESYIESLPGQGGGGRARPQQEFRVSTAGQIQGELVSAIDKASKLTGVPPALIGAMSGIESGFGKNLYSPTGAVGSFQQTGGYRDAMWKKHGDFIAQHVAEARDAMAGGLSKDEKKSLAFNNESAALMTALAARDFAAKRGIDLNDKKNWGLVYAEHNSGAASVDRLLRGEMTDKFIRDCNPAVYRGKNSADEVLAGFQNKIMGYAKAYEVLEDKYEAKALASSKPAADAAIAKASASSLTEGALLKASSTTGGTVKVAANNPLGGKPELLLQ